MNQDRGSGTVVVFMTAALLVASLVALSSLSALYGARLRASTAADAAALAAAVASYPPAGGGDPWGEAKTYAALNGVSVFSCSCQVDSSLAVRTVTVVVETSVNVPVFGKLDVRAGARGEFDPAAWLTG